MIGKFRWLKAILQDCAVKRWWRVSSCTELLDLKLLALLLIWAHNLRPICFDALTKLVDSKRCRTIAYHSEPNGIIERWHFAVIRTNVPQQNLMDRNSFRMFSLQTCYKKDSGMSIAELIYGIMVKVPEIFLLGKKPSNPSSRISAYHTEVTM